MEYGYEILVINDGSKDATSEVVRAYEQKLPGLRLISFKRNLGKGAAVRTGMIEARGEYRLFMDADNSVTIDTVEAFFDAIENEGHDIVIGSIAHPQARYVEHNGYYRRLLGSISKLLIRTVAIPGIRDTQRGFKLFTRAAAEAIFPLQQIERFGFDIEILYIARRHGFSVKEMPVVWDNPAGSTVSPRAYFDSFIELAKILWNGITGKYRPLVEARREGRKRPIPSPRKRRLEGPRNTEELPLPSLIID
jgi:Glycosyltransferases involved in cell wall biogenesis